MALFDGFDRAGAGIRLSVLDGDGRWVDVTGDAWRRAALRAAGGLHRRGVRPGDAVGCVLTNIPAVCHAVPGVWLAGATVVSLPVLARGMSLEAYVALLCAAVEQAGVQVLLVEGRFAGMLGASVGGAAVVAWEDLPGDPLREPDPPGPDDAVFVQYSSGSTSAPKGCVITGRAVERQMRALAEGIALDPTTDHTSMWLPLSHDMGFFGGLTLSFWGGHPLTLMAPERFLRSPGSWLRACAERGATLTALPNFGLDLLARRVRAVPGGRLRLRTVVLGGERNEPGTLDRAAEVLGRMGMPRSSLCPAYGLAECVLAVAMKPDGTEPRTLEVSRPALLAGEVEPAAGAPAGERATLVSAGAPLGDARIRVDGEVVGEICISSSSMASGYAGDGELTRERFRGGELRTRDIGFLHDGELYVLGRTDDMLSIHGRNVYARDIEVALGGRPDLVRPGCCVLLDVPVGGRTGLMVVAEVADSGVARRAGAFEAIARRITDAALEYSGVGVDECAFLARGTLPKTPSGKIQRFRCREIVEQRHEALLARVRV